MIKIGICDDDKNFRTLLAEAIRREDSESFIYEYSTGETLIQDEEMIWIYFFRYSVTGNFRE